MDISTTEPDQQKADLLYQKNLILEIVVSAALILATMSSCVNGVVLSVLMAYSAIFFGLRNEMTRIFPVLYFDIIQSVYFSSLAIAVSFFSGVPILLSIIPVLITLAFQKSMSGLIIPGLLSLAGAFILGDYSNAIFWIVWFGSVMGSWKMQRNISHLTKRVQDNDSQLSTFHSLSAKHLNFVNKMSQSDYAVNDPFDANDRLGLSLFQMGLKFRKSAEDERFHSWQMGGLNDIGAILRSTNDVTASYNKLISFLVKYLNANQGGLFTIDTSDATNAFVELKACYAYEKHKMQEKKQNIESGLIGQCILEKEIIYIERIPENYVHITSGLGLSTPRSLIIVPLKNGDEVVGVIEMASFETIERHQKEFLEKAAEIIGAAIQSFQMNIYTNKMLMESRQLAEELRSQQEEVRQNLEELEATQEHLTREAREREKLESELNKSKEFLNLVLDSVPVPVFVKDRNHKMILLNKAVCDLNNMSKNEMLGKSDYDFFTKDEADVFWNFEEEIFKSKTAAEKIEHAFRNGKETYTLDKKLVVTTDDGDNFLVGINIDVTSAKMMEKQYEKSLSA
jgi:PAS domain S-box-containing protein